MIYELLFGMLPFWNASEDRKTFLRLLELHIRKKDPTFPSHFQFSPVTKDIICKLLNKNPMERLGYNTSDKIRDHKWFKEIDWDNLWKKKINFKKARFYVPDPKHE